MKGQPKLIECTCKSNKFSINLDNIESIAVLTCKNCNKNYFLLDSGEYWYDCIQEGYPPLIKCNKCKNKIFKIGLVYEFEDNSKDIISIAIIGHCESCNNLKNFGTWEIDYSPTDSLIAQPISLVNNPKIKYSLVKNTCYWTKKDLANFINFIFKENLILYCQYFENKKMLIKKVNQREALKRTLNIERVFDSCDFFISNKNILQKKSEINWKKEEVIRICSPTNMTIDGKVGLLFYIECSENYISDFKFGKVEEKSKEFKGIVKKIENWLKSNYVTLRGKGSFDNLEEHKKLFGDEFIKNKLK